MRLPCSAVWVKKLTDGFRDAARAHGFDLVVSGEPALFYLRIANDDRNRQM